MRQRRKFPDGLNSSSISGPVQNSVARAWPVAVGNVRASSSTWPFASQRAFATEIANRQDVHKINPIKDRRMCERFRLNWHRVNISKLTVEGGSRYRCGCYAQQGNLKVYSGIPSVSCPIFCGRGIDLSPFVSGWPNTKDNDHRLQ